MKQFGVQEPTVSSSIAFPLDKIMNDVLVSQPVPGHLLGCDSTANVAG